jgi:hypothetical protein
MRTPIGADAVFVHVVDSRGRMIGRWISPGGAPPRQAGPGQMDDYRIDLDRAGAADSHAGWPHDPVTESVYLAATTLPVPTTLWNCGAIREHRR